jgi:hypothetical protein
MNEQTIPVPTLAEMRALEESLLKPDLRSSPEVLQRMLADDFLEFGASGRSYDKQQVIAGLLNQVEEEFVIDDFCIRHLAPGVILTTYRVTRRRNPSHVAPYSLRSSVWKYLLGHWQMLFHQGTPTDLSTNEHG